jgi:hypothetical protein
VINDIDKQHVKHVKTKAIKWFNLLKCLSRLQWGADLKTHQALVLSVIKYASILEKFNSTHHQGLRIALGTFRSTRIKGRLPIVAGAYTIYNLPYKMCKKGHFGGI